MRSFNPDCLIMGRQYRGISRSKLSKMTGIEVKEIRRIEKNIIVDIPIYDDDRYQLIAGALSFPIGFFKQWHVDIKPRPCIVKYGHCFMCGECRK